ncbi:MAG TPA: T9SS type A sorting domain-containing protein [Bacteroidota bacterium]|jgi:hypothetical protein|nr:T9SS type A sorting domain-containing protein [Bacteroidota bacterium]
MLDGQSVTHPWFVIDRGGGKSTAGSLTLRTSIGQPATQSGGSGGLSLESGYIPIMRKLSGTSTIFDFHAEDTWNLLSVPLRVEDFRKTSLYPTATSEAFAYSGAYQQRDTLKNLSGYWMKFSAPWIVQFSGTAFSTDTLDVTNGWNMIGCLSYPVLLSGITPIPPTTISSNYFGYSGASGYFIEDTLKPTRAYWIKVNNTGKLEMTSGSVLSSPSLASSSAIRPRVGGLEKPEATDNMSMLIFRDAQGRERTLYFSTTGVDLDLPSYELPPASPSFDARYSTNRMVEVAEQGTSKEVAIHISEAEYPLTISWKNASEASLLVDKTLVPIEGTGETQILTETSTIKLKLDRSGDTEIPKEFALHQNYPNPFNPVTVIRYQLPVNSFVNLTVYNAIGQEVAVLVNGMQEAGYKSVDWDAFGSTSGVYMYRLVAGSFTEMRKMIILK